MEIAVDMLTDRPFLLGPFSPGQMAMRGGVVTLRCAVTRDHLVAVERLRRMGFSLRYIGIRATQQADHHKHGCDRRRFGDTAA